MVNTDSVYNTPLQLRVDILVARDSGLVQICVFGRTCHYTPKRLFRCMGTEVIAVESSTGNACEHSFIHVGEKFTVPLCIFNFLARPILIDLLEMRRYYTWMRRYKSFCGTPRHTSWDDGVGALIVEGSW